MNYERFASTVARSIGKGIEVVVRATIIGIVALLHQTSKVLRMVFKNQTIRGGLSKLRRVISR